MSTVFRVITNPFTGGNAIRGAYAPSLNRVVVGGFNGAGGITVASSDDSGTTWLAHGNPVTTQTLDVAYSASLGRFVAVGVGGNNVATSPDGLVWTSHVVDGGATITGVAWSDTQSKFVAISDKVYTSPDGLTWTIRSTPGAYDIGTQVAWSAALGLWVIGDDCAQIFTSPTGVVWTQRANPLDDGSCFGTISAVEWVANSGVFYAGGLSPTGTGPSVIRSTDGLTWTAVSTPFNSHQVTALGQFNASVLVGSALSPFIIESTNGSTWTHDGTIPALPTGFVTIGLSAVLALGSFGVAVGTAAPATTRFYQGYEWRFIVTSLIGATQTFLDPLAMNRAVTYTLNDAAIATLDLPADNPEVNITVLGEPFVSFADKLLFGFRREQPGSVNKWVVRFAGLIEMLNDEITPDSDAPVTHLTAYDPWHYLDSRPVVDNAQLKLPGQGGVTYPANGTWTAASIARDVLVKSIAYSFHTEGPMPLAAQNCYIDVETGNVPPAFDATAPIIENYNFQQGMTVGDAWRQLTTDGLCDIILTPKWPMVTDPAMLGAGGIVQLNIYPLAGSAQNQAQFAWDMPGDSLNGLNRVQDASTMANHVVLYAGASGIPVVAPPNAQSVQQYGPYWYQDSVTGKQAYLGSVADTALGQVLQRAYGQPTLALDPAPERSPIPLIDYGLGDSVPVWTSIRFRQQIRPVLNLAGTGWDGLGRVWTIPILLPDDGPETVSQMVVQIFPVPAPLSPPSMFNVIAPTWTAVRAARRRPFHKLKKPFTG